MEKTEKELKEKAGKVSEEGKELNKELKELSEEELENVAGGLLIPYR